MTEPKYKVSQDCRPKTPPFKPQYRWYVPDDHVERAALIKRLKERLQLFECNESVPRTSRRSTWHCRGCRTNMTRGYLQYILDEVEEKRTEKYYDQMRRIEQDRVEKENDRQNRLAYLKIQRVQSLLKKEYPNVNDRDKFKRVARRFGLDLSRINGVNMK